MEDKYLKYFMFYSSWHDKNQQQIPLKDFELARVQLPRERKSIFPLRSSGSFIYHRLRTWSLEN